MRQFKIEGDWCLDEHGMRVGRVVTEDWIHERRDGKIVEGPGLKSVKMFDDRFMQSGDKLLRKDLRDVQGFIDLDGIEPTR